MGVSTVGVAACATETDGGWIDESGVLFVEFRGAFALEGLGRELGVSNPARNPRRILAVGQRDEWERGQQSVRTLELWGGQSPCLSRRTIVPDPQSNQLYGYCPQCNATQINAMGVESPKSDQEHRPGIPHHLAPISRHSP